MVAHFHWLRCLHENAGTHDAIDAPGLRVDGHVVESVLVEARQCLVGCAGIYQRAGTVPRLHNDQLLRAFVTFRRIAGADCRRQRFCRKLQFCIEKFIGFVADARVERAAGDSRTDQRTTDQPEQQLLPDRPHSCPGTI